MERTPFNARKLAVTLSLSMLAGLSLVSPTSAAPDDAVITVTFTADDMGFTATSTKDLSNIIVELCGGTVHKHDGLTGPSYTHTEATAIVGVWVKSGNNGIGGSAPPGAGERFDNAGVDCTPEEPEEPEEPGSNTTSTTSAPAQHTICHATGSESNPYVVVTASVAGVFNGHLGAGHQDGEDIIPPFTHEGQVYSQNWDEAHQAIFDNGCELVTTSSSSTSEEPETPSETTTGPPPTSTQPPSTPPAEIPVFPSWSSLALGVLGALGGAFAILRRKLP